MLWQANIVLQRNSTFIPGNQVNSTTLNLSFAPQHFRKDSLDFPGIFNEIQFAKPKMGLQIDDWINSKECRDLFWSN
jgi:hypothetical protein